MCIMLPLHSMIIMLTQQVNFLIDDLAALLSLDVLEILHSL